MTLIKFEDSDEKQKVLGPLFATTAKAEIPVFGPNRYTSPKTTALLETSIKKSMESSEDPVTDLLVLANSADQTPLGPLPTKLSQLHLESNTKTDAKHIGSPSGPVSPKKVYSSRELHDRLLYSAMNRQSLTKSQNEMLDTTKLRRAEGGYLFNCEANKSITVDDRWIQDVWEWIAGNLYLF